MDWMRYALNIIATILIVVLLAAVAIRRDGTIMGKNPTEMINSKQMSSDASNINTDVMTELGLEGRTPVVIDKQTWMMGNIVIVSTAEYGKKIYGYGGNTPLFLAIENNTIVGIAAGNNNETPAYWRNVENAGILKQWVGKNLNEVGDVRPDVVSGATMSCDAVQYNVIYAANAIAGKEFKNPNAISLKQIAGLCVLVICVLAPFFFKSKWWRIAQLMLSVGVLGLWCGSFLSLSLFINWLSNGMNVLVAIVPATMVMLAVVMPFFGKKDFYCTHVCPFGAAQELVGKIPARKIRMSARLIKVLTTVREVITLLLIALMVIGVGAAYDIINYEAFSVFMFGAASWVVIILACTFLVLSLFVSKPYCRFLCPTGQLLRWGNFRKI